jgi:hypothetical protein
MKVLDSSSKILKLAEKPLEPLGVKTQRDFWMFTFLNFDGKLHDPPPPI